MGKVALRQDDATDAQPGFLLFLPVYRPDAPHDILADRRAGLMGWAYSALRMRDLMQGVLETIGFDQLSPTLRVEVYDSDRQTPDAPTLRA